MDRLKRKEYAMTFIRARGATVLKMTGALLLASLASLASNAWCQDTGLPSLLPLPPMATAPNGYALAPGGYAVASTAATDALWGQAEPSPVPQVGNAPAPSQSVMGPEYYDAMQGDYTGGSCTTCGPTGCHNHYVFANALLMTHVKQGGFVPGVDSATGSAALFFCQPEFGNLWHGGFEIGTGWCFGSGCNNALEVVYWGLYPAAGSAIARGSLDSTIDFGDLTYNGANANTFYQNATIQEVQYGFNFNSVEANLVGNGCCGGPFGCGMCGCCNGRGGSPWGFGWVGGFRYINFSEQFLYRSDTTDNNFNGDATELNYAMGLNNNLFGFQLGAGLSYCVTNSLTAYSIAKFGIYDNRVSQLQTVYGTQGTATINNGPFNGDDFNVRSTDNVFAGAGQFDLGGRWAVNDSWSVNFGYRVMALSGVAISEVNAVRDQFQNVAGIASQQTTGSFIMHGGYVGATYCF
jgi:opacity protein-like surface antigen